MYTCITSCVLHVYEYVQVLNVVDNTVLLVSLSHVVTHGCPVESHVAMEERGHLFSTLTQQALLLK